MPSVIRAKTRSSVSRNASEGFPVFSLVWMSETRAFSRSVLSFAISSCLLTLTNRLSPCEPEYLFDLGCQRPRDWGRDGIGDLCNLGAQCPREAVSMREPLQ